MVYIRRPHKPHSHPQLLPRALAQKRINFCHPAYPYPGNTLLTFPALDLPEELAENGSLDISKAGVHHETARVACAILANNKWERGFFTAGSPGGLRVQAGPDEILTEERYYFHTGEGEESTQYPIVHDFKDYRFPHDEPGLPAYWRSLTVPAFPDSDTSRYRDIRSVFERDVSCRLTGTSLATEKAHIIPSKHLEWFDANNMDVYRRGNDLTVQSAIDNPSNVLVLCRNTHHLMDSGHFAIVPKTIRSDDDRILTYSSSLLSLLIHVFRADARGELVESYHNVPMLPLSGISVEYLFSAFASLIFSLSVFFKHDGVTRRGLMWRNAKQTLENVDVMLLPRKNRSPLKRGSGSPSKRSRTEESSQPVEEQDDAGTTSDLSDSSGPPSRGRPKRRSWESAFNSISTGWGSDASSEDDRPSRKRARKRSFEAASTEAPEAMRAEVVGRY